MADPTVVDWARPGHQPALVAIARALTPELDERSTRRLQLDLQYQHALIARGSSGPLGFITCFLAEGRAHVAWVVVPATRLGEEVRRQLLTRMTRDVGRLGVRDVCADEPTPGAPLP